MDKIFEANWIKTGSDIGEAVPIFSKTFKKENAKKVFLQVTALGVYCAFINGKKISNYVLAPGWTDYRNRLQYQTYDITDMIKDENLLQIGVGKGWFMHYPEIEDGALICAIICENNDGSIDTIYSDNTWTYGTEKTLYSNMYNGETFDTNKEYVELGNCTETSHKKDILIPQEGEIICEHERLEGKEIIITPSGDTVIDFGQNMTGYVEVKFKGNKGDEFCFNHAEVLDKDGEFYIENMRGAKNEIRLICDGNEHTFKPHYTFQGFRYIKLMNWTEEVKLENFTAIVVHSQMKRTGHFKSSSPMLNQLFHNVIWGQKGNFLDVPTDCPQRDERLGWTGDAQVFIRCATYNYDVQKFFHKWLADLKSDQHADGRIPHIIPRITRFKEDANSSAAWADAGVICPWQIYLTYGDKEILEKQYDSMKKWVDYLKDSAEDYLWLQTEHFGDWLGIDAKNEKGDLIATTDKTLIATAYFAYSTELFIKSSKALGIETDEYETLLGNIKKAYQNKYMADGRVKNATQTGCAVTIYFDLCEDKAEVAKQLAELIDEAGYMTTGFVGTPYLLHVLSENGYSEKAYELLLREEYPSWLFSITKGATTIWEHWDGIKPDGTMWSAGMNSFNHYAYGAVADWMYGVITGINTDENNPGFKHIVLKPIVTEKLSFAESSIDTKYGLVKSSWKRENSKVNYSFTVPNGAVATLYLDGEKLALGSGEHNFTV